MSAHPDIAATLLPGFIGTDGDVTRLHYADGSPYPGNAVLGRIDDLSYTQDVARRVGESPLPACLPPELPVPRLQVQFSTMKEPA